MKKLTLVYLPDITDGVMRLALCWRGSVVASIPCRKF